MSEHQMRIDAQLGLVPILAEEAHRAKAEACLRSALLPHARRLAGNALARRKPSDQALNTPIRKKRDPLKSPSFLRSSVKLGKGAAVPRNAPCPCASGRKFKACCGA